ncbi:hypothetical protein [Nocardiopsis sp. NPDC006938]|uniref:hypothetical protein n=1 Tax=Nocardiopsis sp. NPDC006938 TaxID=3364337 RepID=UPI0036AF99AB
MDGVLTRTATGRPRVAAVGALLAVCLVGAPLMSLFPGAVWNLALSLDTGRPELATLLVTPVAVGGTVLMVLFVAAVLGLAGMPQPTPCACLVAGTSLATPLVMALQSPVFRPVPGDAPANAMAVSAVVATSALVACAVFGRGRDHGGVLSGVAVAAAGLMMLPLAAEHTRDRSTEQRSISQIHGFGHTIAVLDHPRWDPVRVHEVHGGLRMTYVAEDADGSPSAVPERGVPPHDADAEPPREAPTAEDSPTVGAVSAGPGVGADRSGESWPRALHVLSWTSEQSAEGPRSGCGYPGVECTERDEMVVVHRGIDSRCGPRLSEVRVRLDDGSVASVHPSSAVAPEVLFAVARTLRAENDGERSALVEEVLRG